MTVTTPSPTAQHSHRELLAAPAVPSHGRLRPLGVGEVRITGGFWGERQRVNATATIGHIEHWLEREGWLGNFDLAASGALPDGRRGREFSDSEVYKYLEAVAWELERSPDPELEQRFRRTVDRVAAAQEPDGYLNTRFGRPGQQPRWSDLEWGHELYCFGHLFQAAVARERTAPGADDGLLGVAVRVAELVCDVFGEGGIQSVCGHPEVEMALAELGRVTGNRRYIDQARLFIERRGHGVLEDIEWGRSYYQDDVPVRDADVLRGHAVRANYLSSGAVDVAVETNDTGLLEALARQWSATVARRTYITGGQGSHHQDEAFGEDFELPSDRAYSETCAGIASIQFSWRLMLALGDSGHADLIERTLFNVVATSPSADGTAFYYANTLHQRRPGEEPDADHPSVRASSSLRAPWFEVSCCPPNVARTFASLAAYLATVDDDGLQLHQFAPSSIQTSLPDGEPIRVSVTTEYPRLGEIDITIESDATREWTLSLRVPAWARAATLSYLPVDGEQEDFAAKPGSARLRRQFSAGDRIRLTVPLEPRFTMPDQRIDAIRGCVAVERGPEVFALESVDLPGGADVAEATVDVETPLDEREGTVFVGVRLTPLPRHEWPYSDTESMSAAPRVQRVALTRYHAWANRGPSTMRVWLPLT